MEGLMLSRVLIVASAYAVILVALVPRVVFADIAPQDFTDIVLSSVPAPSSLALLVIGGLGLGWWLRRRHK